MKALGDLEKRFMVGEGREGRGLRLGGRLGREWDPKRGGD